MNFSFEKNTDVDEHMIYAGYRDVALNLRFRSEEAVALGLDGLCHCLCLSAFASVSVSVSVCASLPVPVPVCLPVFTGLFVFLCVLECLCDR
jgi:hypothetical protein